MTHPPLAILTMTSLIPGLIPLVIVRPFCHLYTLSQGSFLDSKDAKNDEDENSASNLILHPSAFIMTRFTTTPHNGLTDKDFIIASNYGPDSIFYNHHKFPSELLQ